MTRNRISLLVFLVAGVASATPPTAPNPLMEPWTGPHGGVPP
ncbi:hypothetical protein [Myxococcus stipitatus]|nr:hypothetical protein [Myxococcus stipitatus]